MRPVERLLTAPARAASAALCSQSACASALRLGLVAGARSFCLVATSLTASSRVPIFLFFFSFSRYLFFPPDKKKAQKKGVEGDAIMMRVVPTTRSVGRTASPASETSEWSSVTSTDAPFASVTRNIRFVVSWRTAASTG